MPADDAFLASFMDDYFAECDEHLVEIRRLLLELSRVTSGYAPPNVLEELFRSFHSIKGISGMVELRQAETLAHHMESYLRALRQREVLLDQDGVNALISGTDALEETIAARRADRPAPQRNDVIEALARVTQGQNKADAPAPATGEEAAPNHPAWIVTFVPSAEFIARGINVDTVRQRLRGLGRIVDAAPRVTPGGITFEFTLAGAIDEATRQALRNEGLTIAAAADRPAVDPGEPAAAGSGSRLAVAHVVRVDMARLDDLMRMIGDLVISRARLSSALERVQRHVPPIEWRAVQENTQTIERQLRDLRDGVMRVRLVPVGEIFRRMPLVVRDLAREMGKQVRLELRGQETEIDKFVIERMMDPVLHLVRNAVSHGFERPEDRLAAGKPAEGTLTLSAASVGESVILEVADDGRGIDAGAVAARAREAGLPVPDGPLDAATLLDTICAPGFSTRQETDRASGRGVGMAVVKTTVEELNGSITLQTAPGEGARFVMELPVTLSIADALLAHVGDRVFAVPQTAVREIVEIEPSRIRAIERHEIVPHRGSSLPVLRLSRLFGLPSAPRRALHILVHGAGSEAVGIVADRISGQREIVVRAIQDSLARVEGVSGATDLGDGRVVLILDLPALARAARRGATQAAGVERTR